MTRPWNFSAGPATLPQPVLEQAAAEMLDWQGCGMSVMEMSHRGKQFGHIRNEAEQDLRELLHIPDDFAVLFLQGGATAQNALVPLNLIGRSKANQADYVLSGRWSNKSFQEAQPYGAVAVAASSGEATEIEGQPQDAWTWFPDPAQWQIRSDAAYVHMCGNETVGGVQLTELPDLAQLGAPDIPLVIDASSDFLSHPVDFSRVGMLYAGAQKNAGPAGVTIVIVRKDLLGHAHPLCPTPFNYAHLEAADSMFNTPPTYAIYMVGLVLKWLRQQGGVVAMQEASKAKSQVLYDYLDSTSFYRSTVAKPWRSRMNIPFLLHDNALDTVFLSEAQDAGLLQLKGHKSVGGMRASIYNAMPMEGVKALVSFMQGFEQRHG